MILAKEMALVEKEAAEDAIAEMKKYRMSMDSGEDLAFGAGMRHALIMLGLYQEDEMRIRKDTEKYDRQAKRILTAIDKSRVPVGWEIKDEPALVDVIAKELIKMELEESL
ncbi:MAG: hypothetical protein LUC27_02905 [Lachnospiraceae bacterium]|nr:hypothetical protein [Lachnospiraceae bacterium]